MPKKIMNTCLLTICLLLTACNGFLNQTEPRPSNLLSKDAFKKVLVDMALAESASNMNIKSIAVSKMDSVYNFQPLLENGIRKSQYDSTIIYYANHSEQYKQVYEEALAFISEIQSKRSTSAKDTVLK